MRTDGQKEKGQSVLPAATVERIERIVRELAKRLGSPDQVREAIATVQQQAGMDVPADAWQWKEHDLFSGFAGFCLLFAQMDHQWPDEGWDAVGHAYLVQVQQALQREGVGSLSLSNGLAGIGMAAYALSRQGQRYQKMIETINQSLVTYLPNQLEAAVAKFTTGVESTDYDAVVGVAGIGRYLLLFADQEPMRQALCAVLDYLVLLSGEKEVEGQRVPAWLTSRALRADGNGEDAESTSFFDCGLAHGIPGPLALLAIALREGVEVPGQREAMERIGTWLMQWRQERESGSFWPSLITLEEWRQGSVEHDFDRGGWCYGTPGVARALWLAGDVLDQEEWKQAALDAYLGFFGRKEQWEGQAPTFCHGLIGLLQMTQRMYVDSGAEQLAVYRDELVEQVLALYDPDSAFGYYDWETATDGQLRRADQPWLIEGASGSALVLLGLLGTKSVEWDAVWLIA